MTTNETIPALNCFTCGEQHPPHLSVEFNPPGLSCGLACMSDEMRTLLGLPDPEDAAIGAIPTPPRIKGWKQNSSKHFHADLTHPDKPSGLNQSHFRYAMNVIGLGNILRAQQPTPETTTLGINRSEVIFTAYSYTSAAGAVNVWMEALTTGDNPQVIAMARMSWNENPNDPQTQPAHRAAVQFITNRPP